MVLQHCRAEILENGNAAAVVLLGLYIICDCRGERDAAALHHDVDVISFPSQEAVSYETAYHKGSYADVFRHFRNYPEYGVLQISFCQGHVILNFTSCVTPVPASAYMSVLPSKS